MPSARFETKPGSDSGSGYERWRSYERRPSTDVAGKEDVYVAHHRLLAVVECYPSSMSLEAILRDLDGKDVHHANGVKWDNRPSNIEPIDHGEHAALHARTAQEPLPDAGGVQEVPADD
ncbi:HNH endonuclease [haloarchaeon 3A1-DGR]|nr:HNH endonuclease [haloarchaeon 3A1-DGR]